MPEELWTEVLDIIKGTVIKTIHKKKKYKMAKWLSEEALKVTEKRGGAEGKAEKKSYAHLNTELQRIARRDGKAILSDPCKEIEENKRMGETRDSSLQENQRYQGNISCKDEHNQGQ